jgi:pimeloyl-ACP methyl ester carboxylesterase
MLPWRVAKPYVVLTAIVAAAYAAYAVIVGLNQRSLIYFPTHEVVETTLQPWIADGRLIGYCRPVEHPRTIWLMTHGNGGQAAHRAYVLRRMSEKDALYVMEYPGYGLRSGAPSSTAFNRAAAEAFQLLRRDFPRSPVGVIGESIGSGPASSLALLPNPPDKIILVVPFDSFANVAAAHMPMLPVRAMLKDNWDNIETLKNFAGPLDVYGATDDRIVGLDSAKNLAAHLPRAKFVEIPGGHNDWSNSDLVRIEK